MYRVLSSLLLKLSSVTPYLVFAAIIFEFLHSPGTAKASTAQNAPDLCIAAAETAANLTGVPLPVLLAITLVETGQSTKVGIQPWPWTINQAGKGHWFQTPEDAIEYAEEQLDLGQQNFDVGCFQINHRWHSKGFTSTADMFDPASNALYAAKFLSKIYSEVGDWSLSAATYHSRTPELADRYRAKFDTALSRLAGLSQDEDFAPSAAPRINQFPLLQVGSSGKAGSLVPLVSTGRRLIGDQP